MGSLSVRTRSLAGAVAFLASMSWGLVPAAAEPPDAGLGWIVELAPGVDPSTTGLQVARLHGADVDRVYTHVLGGFSFTGSSLVANALKHDPRVRSVVADQPVAAFIQVMPTGVDRVDADLTGAGDGTGAVDVDIAILDTGVDVDHPDLNVVGGKNCTSETTFDDGHGHGTHVAGIAAALDNSQGVVGVAAGARIWAVKVLDSSGSGTLSSVICGIDWVTANASTIEVANLSLGGSGPTGTCTDGGLNEAICELANAGVTIVVAAGNDGVDAGMVVPAAYDEVITVSALADFDGQPGGRAGPTCYSDIDDTFADFSNYGAVVDLIAPGVCIKSTYRGGGYATVSGTSMAAPHVAGAAALYLAANPAASPSEVKSALQGLGNLDWDADDDPDGTKEVLVNVASATTPSPPPPQPAMSPPPQPAMSPPPATPSGPETATFVALPSPQRLFDTRTDGNAGYVRAGQTITRQVVGLAGVPPTGVTSVVLNVTGVDSGGEGFVTVWPTDAPQPNTSSLNFTEANQTRPNLVVVPVGPSGAVNLYAQSGAHLIADVAGYFRPAAAATSGRLSPLAPQRLLDTRTGIGATPTKPGPNTGFGLQVTGRGGVPSSGVAAVVLNITATDATAAGYVTVWPTGQPRPNASNLNLAAAHDTNANLVIAPVGAGGQVNLFTETGTHLVADVVGWFGDTTQPSSASGLFVTLTPGRIFDTRSDAALSANTSITRTHTGIAGIPTSGVAAVSLNITATNATSAGYLTAWAQGDAPPNASTLNLHQTGDTRPNAAILPISPAGTVSFYSERGSHIIADTTGYFTT